MVINFSLINFLIFLRLHINDLLVVWLLKKLGIQDLKSFKWLEEWTVLGSKGDGDWLGLHLFWGLHLGLVDHLRSWLSLLWLWGLLGLWLWG